MATIESKLFLWFFEADCLHVGLGQSPARLGSAFSRAHRLLFNHRLQKCIAGSPKPCESRSERAQLDFRAARHHTKG
jgi:hypothetical protein